MSGNNQHSKSGFGFHPAYKIGMARFSRTEPFIKSIHPPDTTDMNKFTYPPEKSIPTELQLELFSESEQKRRHPRPPTGFLPAAKKRRRNQQEQSPKWSPFHDGQWHRRAETWRSSGRSVLSHGFIDLLEGRH